MRRVSAKFAWRNGISLNGRCQFRSDPVAPPSAVARCDLPRRTCVPVGGGKDSIVTLECLKRPARTSCCSRLATRNRSRPALPHAGLPSIRVTSPARSGAVRAQRGGRAQRPCADHRHPQHDRAGLRDHLPASIRSRCRTSIRPARPTLSSMGRESTTSTASRSNSSGVLADLRRPRMSRRALRYFSLLRPLSEVEIARRFAQHPAIFRRVPQLQYRVPPVAGRSADSTGAAIARNAASCSWRWRRSSAKAASDRYLRPQHARR